MSNTIERELQMSSFSDNQDDYFCIGADGRLWVLGNHGDYEAAEDTAASLNVDVVWMFGKQTATDWRDSLLQAIPNETRTTALTQMEQSLLQLCQQSLQALHEDDYPHLRNQLREAVAKAENAVLTEVGLGSCQSFKD